MFKNIQQMNHNVQERKLPNWLLSICLLSGVDKSRLEGDDLIVVDDGRRVFLVDGARDLGGRVEEGLEKLEGDLAIGANKSIRLTRWHLKKYFQF